MTARRPLIAGNWKMNGTGDDLAEVIAIAAAANQAPGVDVALCVPATLVERAARAAPSLAVGGQDAHAAPGGAFTGDVSTAMLIDAGAKVPGGIEAGRRILAAAAGNVKRVALELGGKSPNIVFADADFDAALDNALAGAFAHSGQVCSAGCRIIVENDRPGVTFTVPRNWAVSCGLKPSLPPKSCTVGTGMIAQLVDG